MRGYLFLGIVIVVLGLSVSSHGALVDMNDGTVYDTDTQLSWLKNAGTGGVKNWADALAWASSLNKGGGFAGLKGWRLPATVQPDKNCSDQITYSGGIPSQGFGYNCISEMAHLFYRGLGNKGYCDASGNSPQTGWGLTNTGPFTNLQAYRYWSGTEYAADNYMAWYFYFHYGIQNSDVIGSYAYAWAVRSGERSVSALALSVPARGTIGLTIIGAAGLIYFYRRRLKRSTRQQSS